MNQRKLGILWTSPDRDVALKMVFMYSRASLKNNWWDEVTLIVWGPAAQLLAVDTELQEYLKVMQDYGVKIVACKSCADMYGVDGKLTELGVKVYFVGKTFTEMLQSNWKTITI